MTITLEYSSEEDSVFISDFKCEQYILDIYNLNSLCEKYIPFATENILYATRTLIAEKKVDHKVFKLKHNNKIYDFNSEGLLFLEGKLCWPDGVGDCVLNFTRRMLEAQINDYDKTDA